MARLGKLLRKLGLFRFSLLMAVTAVTVTLLIGAGLARLNCSLYGYQTERDTKFGTFVGCMVKTSDGYIPRSELRTIAE